jgi:hypothetical protein
MDEGTRGVSADVSVTDGRNGNRPAPPTPESLGNEIVVVREELDALLAEFDRRRHEVLDVRLQLRRHAVGAAITAVAFLATAAGVVWLGVWHQQRRHRPTAQLGRLRDAVSRMIDQPERVAAEPTIAGKVVSAAASAAAASIVKKVLERGVQAYLERHRVAERRIALREGLAPSGIRPAELRETA